MKAYKLPSYTIAVLFIAALLFLQFVVNTKYQFPEPHAFQGKFLYNPYRNMDSAKWAKANFHAHTRLYLRLTDGAANTNQSLNNFYKYFDYNIIGISNYQEIDNFEKNHKWFIPEYEHGYQYYKNHQLIINPKKISWLDYFFRQTLNNKQFIIDQLKKDSSVILTIVHPDKRHAYSFNDFKYLGNYNCLEINNNKQSYTSSYDTILSAGHPVFLMSDDDAHDLSEMNDGCKSFNLINTDLVRDSILYAIRTGRLVGVLLNTGSFKTSDEKKAGLGKLPKIKYIGLKGDTLTVSLNQIVKSVKFIGQGGTEKMKINNVAIASYLFSKQDTYIRTEIECNGGTLYFLNPIFRYNGTQLTDQIPKPDLRETRLSRISAAFILLMTYVLLRKKWLHILAFNYSSSIVRNTKRVRPQRQH